MLVAKVRRSLRAEGLVPRGARVLCAFSGGPDSTALLHVLLALAPECGFEVSAATVDHGLVPGSAERARRALEYARALDVQCEVLSLALPRGSGRQARARRGRYAALTAHAASIGASRIAVGHTLDDQAETVLARLLRGAGLRGLTGVLRRREDGVVRPLLDVTRLEVEEYLRHLGVRAPVEDPANEDRADQRVRVRREILPALARENPRAPHALAALADEATELRVWLEQLADDCERQARRGEALDLEVLRAAPGPVRREVLRRWTGLPTGRAHLDALGALVRTGRGDVLLPGGRRVVVEEGCVVVEEGSVRAVPALAQSAMARSDAGVAPRAADVEVPSASSHDEDTPSPFGVGAREEA